MTVTTPYALAWDLPAHDEATSPPLVDLEARSEAWPPRWIVTPPTRMRPVPEPQRQVKEIREWTGLSNRALADALGTTHPTIGTLLSGQSVDFARRPEVRRSLADLHALCERLAPLVEFDSTRLLDLLYVRGSDDRRLIDLAARGSVSRAYLLALRALTPMDDSEFPRSVFDSEAGAATTALHD